MLLGPAAEGDPDRRRAGSCGDQRQRGLQHPDRRVAEALPHLQADERGEREPDRCGAPNAPMYAPRRSSGARPATAVCEVGTQSISPITNTNRISSTTGSAAFTESSRKGSPISGSPTASLTPAGTAATRWVSLSWKKVTRSGFMIKRKPQVEFE